MFELKTSQDIKNELEQITYNNMCCYTGYYNKQQIIITFNDGNGNTFNKIYYIPSKQLYSYFKRCLRKINKYNLKEKTIKETEFKKQMQELIKEPGNKRAKNYKK